MYHLCELCVPNMCDSFIMCRSLLFFKTTFEEFQPSDFRFPKYHLTTHYTWFVSEYGSLHSVSTTHCKYYIVYSCKYSMLISNSFMCVTAERLHKAEVKPMFQRTSRKKRTAQAEMTGVLQMSNYLQDIIDYVGLEIPR